MNIAIARCAAGAFALGCCAASPSLAQEAPAAPTEAAAGGDRLVDILNYRIEGNTVLPRVEVEKAVMPFLGPKRPASDVEAARAALEKAYRSRGYETVAVEIPAQDVQGGIIRMNVVELKVGRLRVTNARHYSPEAIRDDVPALAEGKVPNYREVSQQIATVNKAGGRMVSPTLRAGDTPGTVDVDLQVEDESPVHGSLELNDRNSSRTKRLRASASLRYANLFHLGHSLSLQAQTTPTKPGQSWALSGSYVAPLGDGVSVLGYGVHSNSDIAAIGGIGVLGSGDIFGLRGLYSFTTGSPTAPTVHQLIAGIDYKSFRENLVLGADTAATPIDYVPATFQYSIAQNRADHEFSLSVGVNAGLRGLGSTDRQFRNKRFNSSASWMSLRGDIAYSWKLPGDWTVRNSLSGQIASGPLISNEQFSAGGLDSVRGYYESQQLGDDGFSTQLQVDTPSLAPRNDRWLNDLRLFAFTDAAKLYVRDPLSSQSGSARLVSVGGGFRYRMLGHLNGSALIAAPLVGKDDVQLDISDAVRVQFRLWTEF
jgi:hemolysin activation/secretion protein